MSYRLKPGKPLATEVRRLVDKQLRLAVDDLRSLGDPKSDDRVHEARRHLKKARALLRLSRRALGDDYGAANRRLRHASRLLAPIADAESVVDTLARFKERYAQRLSPRTFSRMKAALLRHEAVVDRLARHDHVLEEVASILRDERRAIGEWSIRPSRRLLLKGLRKTIRASRRAMNEAASHPTAAAFHAWRRRVKDHWFQVRVLEAECGNKLLTNQRRLEALDGRLGETHNCVVLERMLMADALLSPAETAVSVRLLRKYEIRLRHEALQLGAEIYRAKPHWLVDRVDRLWRAAA